MTMAMLLWSCGGVTRMGLGGTLCTQCKPINGSPGVDGAAAGSCGSSVLLQATAISSLVCLRPQATVVPGSCLHAGVRASSFLIRI